jgi:hypothetical protein
MMQKQHESRVTSHEYATLFVPRTSYLVPRPPQEARNA